MAVFITILLLLDVLAVIIIMQLSIADSDQKLRDWSSVCSGVDSSGFGDAEAQQWHQGFRWVSLAILTAFAVENIFTVAANFPGYFAGFWNWFDFVVVWASILLELLTRSKGALLILARVLRFLKDVFRAMGYSVVCGRRDSGNDRLIHPDDVTEVKELVGRGKFGDAYMARYRSQEVVIKVPRDGTGNIEELLACIQIQPHKNVVQFVGITKYRQKLCFVTRYYNCGSLDKLHAKAKLSSPRWFVKIASDIVAGVRHLHEVLEVVHRDIRAENVFVEGDLTKGPSGIKAVIGDWGLVRRAGTGTNSDERKERIKRLASQYVDQDPDAGLKAALSSRRDSKEPARLDPRTLSAVAETRESKAMVELVSLQNGSNSPQSHYVATTGISAGISASNLPCSTTERYQPKSWDDYGFGTSPGSRDNASDDPASATEASEPRSEQTRTDGPDHAVPTTDESRPKGTQSMYTRFPDASVFASEHNRDRKTEASPWPWTAPEAWILEVHSAKSDVYMMGVTMWEILTAGASPYQWDQAGVDPSETLYRVLNGSLRLKIPDKTPLLLYCLVRACLDPNPARRPTAAMLSLWLNELRCEPGGSCEWLPLLWKRQQAKASTAKFLRRAPVSSPASKLSHPLHCLLHAGFLCDFELLGREFRKQPRPVHTRLLASADREMRCEVKRDWETLLSRPNIASEIPADKQHAENRTRVRCMGHFLVSVRDCGDSPDLFMWRQWLPCVRYFKRLAAGWTRAGTRPPTIQQINRSRASSADYKGQNMPQTPNFLGRLTTQVSEAKMRRNDPGRGVRTGTASIDPFARGPSLDVSRLASIADDPHRRRASAPPELTTGAAPDTKR